RFISLHFYLSLQPLAKSFITIMHAYTYICSYGMAYKSFGTIFFQSTMTTEYIEQLEKKINMTKIVDLLDKIVNQQMEICDVFGSDDYPQRAEGISTEHL